VPGQAWSGVGDFPPPDAASSPTLSRHWRRCGRCRGSDRATRGRPTNPARSRLLQCCASNRGRGGCQLRGSRLRAVRVTWTVVAEICRFPSIFPRRAIWAMTNRVPQAKGRWQPNAPRRKPNVATRSYSRNRSRRASQVAARPGEGPLTEPTAAVRPRLRGDTPEIPWLARWVGSSAQGGNECNRTAMLAGSPTALSASRRKNSRNEVLGGGTEVCISVDRVAEGARTRIGR